MSTFSIESSTCLAGMYAFSTFQKNDEIKYHGHFSSIEHYWLLRNLDEDNNSKQILSLPHKNDIIFSEYYEGHVPF